MIHKWQKINWFAIGKKKSIYIIRIFEKCEDTKRAIKKNTRYAKILSLDRQKSFSLNYLPYHVHVRVHVLYVPHDVQGGGYVPRDVDLKNMQYMNHKNRVFLLFWFFFRFFLKFNTRHS